MNEDDYLDRIAHLELLVEHYKDRYAQLLDIAQDDARCLTEMADQFKEFNTSLTVAASTLENAMSRIIAMQPVVEDAIKYVNDGITRRQLEKTVETFKRISVAS